MAGPIDTGLKRALDVVVASGCLFATAPILGGAALAIRLTMGRPVLFAQLRLGFRGTPFVLYKLRTMKLASGPWNPSTDAARLTRLGRMLRRWSVDELPQLWNVLKGDMSLVGPRPLPVEYGSRYSSEQFRRHDVRPGITGWAQIHGRNTTNWAARLSLDVWYVRNRSLSLDLRILARTLRVVLTGSGVSGAAGATMTEFGGES